MKTTLIALFFSSSLMAQQNFWHSKNAYLGQKPPGEYPEIFAQGRLVDSGFAFCRIAFSNNGTELLYTFAKSWYDHTGSGTNSIVFENGQWQKPQLVCKELVIPTLSLDGNQLFLSGKGGNIWIADKTVQGWSSPRKYLDLPFGLYNFMPTNSGNIYVGSNGTWGEKSNFQSYQFAVLNINKQDTSINSLGNTLNKPGFNGDLYIAPDESYIIISTNESPTYESELYISFRKENKTWTKAISLGEKINAGKAHRFGQYVSPDGKYLFYTWGTSEKNTNIYWLRFDKLLKKLRNLSLKS